MKAIRPLIVFAAAAVFAVPGSAKAQTINANARVAVALTVLGVDDLEFGDVFQGVAASVDAQADPEAGTFDITGEPGLEVSIDLAFTDLIHATLPANTMTLTPTAFFNELDAAGTSTAFLTSPTTQQLVDLEATAGTMFLFIGGSISPGGAQEPGDYQGTITATVAYTGN